MTFHKTSIKLAGLYLAIMMAISLFFSVAVYQLSIQGLQNGLRRPGRAFEIPAGPGFSSEIRIQVLEDRRLLYEEARDQLIQRLVIINLIILAVGGAACYYLALRTLKPIEEAHEAQSRFTADASHELRTPITVMRSENEVALMDPHLSLAEAKAQLQSNIEELDKLTALSEGLLQLAQLENNQLPTAPLTPADILEAATGRIVAQAATKHITITTDAAASGKVLGEQNSLTEALVILLDNAVKYAPAGSTITATAAKEQHAVLFTVSDAGPGIAPEDLPHIFERFYRADTSRTKQHTHGYGLGLAIAHSIAKAHKGTLSAKSTPGQGASFILTIPAA